MKDHANSSKFKELLRTFNQADIVFIKSLLDEQEIIYYINNEHVDMVGMISFAEPMRLMVAEKDYSSAQELLKDFKSHFTKLSDLEE